MKSPTLDLRLSPSMILRLPRDAPKTQRYAPAVTPLKSRATCHLLRGWSKRYAPRPRSRVTLAYRAYMPAGLPGLRKNSDSYSEQDKLNWRLVNSAGEDPNDDEDPLYSILFTKYYYIFIHIITLLLVRRVYIWLGEYLPILRLKTYNEYKWPRWLRPENRRQIH